MVVVIVADTAATIDSPGSSFSVSLWKLGRRIRSGRGLVGALPYLNCVGFMSVGVSSAFSWPPEPVDPTSVTELKFDGEEGPLNADSVQIEWNIMKFSGF